MKKASAKKLPTVRAEVRKLLTQSSAFRRLSPDKQKQIARDTVTIVGYLAEPNARGHGNIIKEIDFPDFVAGLISGVFDAIVDGSIRQMKAYADLVAGVANSLDQFSDENVSDQEARSHLSEEMPNFFDKRGRKKPQPRLKKRPARRRQQLLATMVMMGINRIVVTDGRIQAKVRF